MQNWTKSIWMVHTMCYIVSTTQSIIRGHHPRESFESIVRRSRASRNCRCEWNKPDLSFWFPSSHSAIRQSFRLELAPVEQTGAHSKTKHHLRSVASLPSLFKTFKLSPSTLIKMVNQPTVKCTCSSACRVLWLITSAIGLCGHYRCAYSPGLLIPTDTEWFTEANPFQKQIFSKHRETAGRLPGY